MKDKDDAKGEISEHDGKSPGSSFPLSFAAQGLDMAFSMVNEIIR